MPLRCYVVPAPAQTTAPNLRTAVEGGGGLHGIRTHGFRNASAAPFRLSYRPSGTFRSSPPEPPRSPVPHEG